MPKTIATLLIALVLSTTTLCAKGQNILPLEWSITTESFNEPKKISTLMSWERQGLSASDGNCILSNHFYIIDSKKRYQIKSRLQCHIDSIFINNTLVASNIDSQFWTDRTAYTIIDIPEKSVEKGLNEIRIFCKDLAWTGGHSHNSFIIQETPNIESENIDIIIDKDDHCFDSIPKKIKLQYNTVDRGRIRLQIEDSFRSKLLDTTLFIPAGRDSVIVALEKLGNKPGFYQCTTTLDSRYHSGDIEWFAVAPEELDAKESKPSDFLDYWDTAKAELESISPDFKMFYSDSLSTANKKAYIVEMQSVEKLTIRAYYFVPKSAGPHYAILHLPGYGDGFENISHIINDDRERIDMALCVRGHGMSADVFNPGFDIPGIWGHKLYSPDSIAYRSIYLDCVRAVDYLCSRPEVDNKRIGVTGGSQGGGLALATAGLCSEQIAACAYFDPFPCDIPEHIDIRTICRQQIRDYLKFYNNPCSFSEALKIQTLIDSRNFAPSITAKVLFAAALFDDDCPPRVGFAAYNDIKSDKQYRIFPHDSHLGESDYYDFFMNWFSSIFSR